MGDRYRLPDTLGGGECEETEVSPVAGYKHVRAAVGSAWAAIHIREDLLTKVEPPLPPEPPPGSIVRDREGAMFERGAGDIWFRRELNSNITYDWASICGGYGTPVRLVPDPAAGVELPWLSASVDQEPIGVRLSDSYNWVIRVVLVDDKGEHYAGLNAATARAMAGALLLAAADAAEAGGAS